MGDRSRSSWILALVAAAGAALVAAGWWVAGADERRLPAERRGSNGGAAGAAQAASADATGPAAPAPSPQRETLEVAVPASDGESNTASADEPAPDARGTLHLTIVDALTAEPLAGLRLEAFSERPTSHVLVRTQTDARGEVSLTRLPEDVLLIETERRPPNCSALGALWLPAGARKSLVLRAGRGGTVRGRVIDDRGEPMHGVHVLVINAAGSIASGWARRETGEMPDDPWVESTTTDSNGRYEVGALVDRPRGVWVVSDAPRPERLDPITIAVRTEAQHATRQVSVREGETKEVEDVVFPRAVELRGHVVDAEERAVAGALVSASYSRAAAHRMWPRFHRNGQGSARWTPRLFTQLRALPGTHEFALLGEECLTDRNGRFVLQQETSLASCLVLTAEGILQQFPTPDLEPGAASDELVLRLADQTLLELVIENERAERTPNEWPLLESVTAVTIGGKELRLIGDIATFDRPHVLRFACVPSAIGTLRIRGWDCEPLEYAADGKLENGQRISVTLEQRKRYQLKLRIARDPSDLGPIADHGVYLSACLGSPEQRASRQHCCGLGAQFASVKLRELPKEHVLEVKTPAPYWVYVDVAGSATGWTKPFAVGPFAPGAEVHAIVLPPIAFEMQPTEQIAKELPPEDVARVDAGSVALRAIDATSHAALKNVELELRKLPDLATRRSWGQRSDQDGICLVPVVPAGSYRALVSADGYQQTEAPCPVEPGKRTDLGTLALVPQPRLEVRVVEWDGSVPDPLPVEVGIEDDAHHQIASPHARINDGCYVFLGDLPPSFTAVAIIRGGVRQSVRCDRAPAERVVEIRLPRRYRVRVRVTGIPDEYREAYLGLELRDVTDQVARASTRPPTPEEERAGTRTYEWSLEAGRYRLRGDSFAIAVPEREIEVAASDEPQEVTIALQ